MSHYNVVVSTDNGTTLQVATDENHVISFLSCALREKDCGIVSLSAEWIE